VEQYQTGIGKTYVTTERTSSQISLVKHLSKQMCQGKARD